MIHAHPSRKAASVSFPSSHVWDNMFMKISLLNSPRRASHKTCPSVQDVGLFFFFFAGGDTSSSRQESSSEKLDAPTLMKNSSSALEEQPHLPDPLQSYCSQPSWLEAGLLPSRQPPRRSPSTAERGAGRFSVLRVSPRGHPPPFQPSQHSFVILQYFSFWDITLRGIRHRG